MSQFPNQTLFKLCIIICAATLPFLFTINGDFVFDDSVAITKNKDVTSKSWLDCFYNDFWGTEIKSELSHKSYRPLTILTFRINYFMSGERLIAIHFKITNLICHIWGCIVLWIFLRTVLNIQNEGFYETSFLTTLLFAVHPIHVEAVSGIVGRADVMASNIFLLAFLVYHFSQSKSKSIWKHLILLTTIILSGISMLFKENGITVLGFCLVYEIMNKMKFMKLKKSTTGNFVINNRFVNLELDSILRILIILSGAILLLSGRWLIMGGSYPEFKPVDNPAAFVENYYTRVKTYNYIYFLNILLLIWPQWLCYDWSMGCIPLLENNMDFRTIFIFIMYIYGGLLIKSLFNNKNHSTTKRSLIIGVSLMILPFLPAANIVRPVGFVIAERILYISSSGYCLLIVIGYKKICNKVNSVKCKVLSAMFLFLLIIYGMRSFQRSGDWQNEYKLFTSGLSVCPLNAKIHYNVAKVADSEQHVEWALMEYKESIRLNPTYYQAMNNLGNLLKTLKRFDEAEYYLREAIKQKNDYPATWMNLGIVLAHKKQYRESEMAYKTAIQHRRKYPDCYYNLGNLYLELNDTNAASECWLQAINLNSKHNLAWTNLLALLDNTGQTDKALKIIPRALNELPDSASVNFAVANIYGKIELYVQAEKYFKIAIKLFGKRVQALHFSNLGVLYHRWKKYSLAKEMYSKAIELDPLFTSAQKNLKTLKRLN